MTKIIAGSDMTTERFAELNGEDYSVRLTPEEYAEGWHFCDDWDIMLIHPSMPEYRACHCNIDFKKAEPKVDQEFWT